MRNHTHIPHENSFSVFMLYKTKLVTFLLSVTPPFFQYCFSMSLLISAYHHYFASNFFHKEKDAEDSILPVYMVAHLFNKHTSKAADYIMFTLT